MCVRGGTEVIMLLLLLGDVCSWKEIEVSVCNGDEAFLEVRVQQSVVEFILNHTEQIFNPGADPPRPLKEGLFTA